MRLKRKGLLLQRLSRKMLRSNSSQRRTARKLSANKLVLRSFSISNNPVLKKKNNSIEFWKNKATWTRAGKNTLNCLIGCSIGDFGMLVFMNAYYPSISMGYVMPLAMASGLVTSVVFESSILKMREGFKWKQAFKTAMSMSFMSMLAMESAENITDYLLTGVLDDN